MARSEPDDDEEDLPGVRARIEALLKQRGVNQAWLATKLGTSEVQISRLLTGKRKLSLMWLRRMAAAIGCHLVDLLDDEDMPFRVSVADKELLEALRSDPDMDATALLAILTGLKAIIASQAARQVTKSKLTGDPAVAGGLADAWSSLSDSQRQIALNLIRATAQLGPASALSTG